MIFITQTLNLLSIYRIIFILLLILQQLFLVAQSNNIGTPFIDNYPKEEYKAATQNWDIHQDTRGNLFIANNDGLLQFDGAEWKLFPLPKKSIVRSVYCDEKANIYVGGQDEFGYFGPDTLGQFIYHDLKPIIDSSHYYFEDVWSIVKSGNRIFFNSKNKIYIIEEGKTKIYDPKSQITHLEEVNGNVIVAANDIGLVLFAGGQFRKMNRSEVLKGMNIQSIIPFPKGTFLIVTRKNGIYHYDGFEFKTWKNEANKVFKENELIAGTKISPNQIAVSLGASKGIYILDKSGKLIRIINKSNGLQNNSALCMHLDNNNDLWVGLDNGVSKIKTSSPFSVIYPDGPNEGTSYGVELHNNRLYAAMNTGLYSIPWKPYYNPTELNKFREVKNTNGQVWGIQEINDVLLMSHVDGGFVIVDNESFKISEEEGSWKFKEFSNDMLVEGSYSGFNIYTNRNGKWRYRNKIDGFEESARIFVEDEDGYLWVSHPYRGVYKLEYFPEKDSLGSKTYGAANGLISDERNYITLINGKPVVGNDHGVFKFSAEKDSFLVHDAFQGYFDENSNIRRLVQDERGNIWFITGKEVGVFKINDTGISKEVKKIVFPEITDKVVPGFEFIYPLDDNNIFFGAEKGLIHLDLSRKKENSQLTASIQTVADLTNGDSLIFNGYYAHSDSVSLTPFKEAISSLPSSHHSYRFNYGSNSLDKASKVMYKYYLDGFDEKWSDFTYKTEKEYTNLPAGNYSFKVVAREGSSNESEIAQYEFKIQAPWYKSWLAIVAYILLFVAGIYLISSAPNKKLQEEANQLRKDREESERIVESLKLEKLQSEVVLKNSELASSAMLLLQKNELLSKVKEDVRKVHVDIKDKDVKKHLAKILRSIKKEEDQDKEWERFAFHFDQVHSNFLKRLRKNYPDLSPKDQKLSAYLRMNLSTKEIAPLLNISVRGVEVSRYRLRKKLDLEGDTNLNDFMMTY